MKKLFKRRSRKNVKGPQEVSSFLLERTSEVWRKRGEGKPKDPVLRGFILFVNPVRPSATEIRGTLSPLRRHMDSELRAEGIASRRLPGEAALWNSRLWDANPVKCHVAVMFPSPPSRVMSLFYSQGAATHRRCGFQTSKPWEGSRVREK